MAVMQGPMNGSVLRIGGAFTAVFSVVVGALVLFAIPTACSFVGSLQLIIFGFLFIGGVLAFLLGQALVWKRKR